jgi:tyrosyl-tRNA synthetase
VGGGTAKIGDPSGRDAERHLLSEDRIEANIKGIKKCFEKVITFGEEKASCVNNAQWLDDLNYTHFLREIGIHFSVNRMLTFDSIKNRLERQSPLSFIEFNYILMQSYDFLELYKTYGCTLQVGGADQWGNIVSGVDLVRRVTGSHVHGLTWPLLQTASGAKMGKTAQGAVWLDETLYSPYQYWQFWRNVDDGDVIRFLKLYTMLSLDEIEKFALLQGQDLIEAKSALADHATALLHGQHCLPAIHKAVQQSFSGEKRGGDEDLAHTLPTYGVSVSEMTPGILLLDILVGLGFVTSRREARQKIREQAVRVHDALITDELFEIKRESFHRDAYIKVSLGIKKHGLIHLSLSLD